MDFIWPTHRGARPRQSEYGFPHNRALLQTEIFSFISCPGGWSQTICRWRSQMWRSWAGVVTRGLQLWGRLEVVLNSLKRGRRLISIFWQQFWWTFLQLICQLHCPSKHETSVALCCVTKLHIIKWPFIVLSTRCTCVMIMLFYQLLDNLYLTGVAYLDKS